MKTNYANKNNTSDTLFHWHGFRLKLVFEGIAIGIVVGLLVVLYRYSLEKAMGILSEIYSFLSTRYFLIPVWVCILVLIGYIVGRLLKYEPMISGSGIPQVEGVLQGKLKMVWWKVILGKFVGGVLSIGSGLSLGREGPSVQLGAAIGQGFAKVFKRIKIEEKYLITSGASAGLAAAFNAPLAGVMFALEEVHKNFSPLVLLSSLAAALSADYISSGFFGLKPVLDFKNLTPVPLKYYHYIIILGIIVGVFGALFNKALLKTQNIYDKIRIIPKPYRVIIPLIISAALGFTLPQVLGGGHELIVTLVKNNTPLTLLLVLLLVKFLFTITSFGSGAPGGIFLPMLAIGALIGNIYGFGLVKLLSLDNGFINNFIILAMAGYFTAVVRAPITGIILITEMTGSFNHLLSLSAVSITAYIIADIIGAHPVYESLLGRILKNQKDKIPAWNYKHKTILEFPICLGSQLDGREIKTVKWPSHSLLIAVKRGEQELIPKGDTFIQSGDYLVMLTNEDRVSKINDLMLALTESK